MTLTLELTDSQKERLLQSAREQDERSLRQILGEALEPMVKKLMGSRSEESVSQSDFENLYQQWVDSFSAAAQGRSLPAGALTRDSLYPDRH